MFDVLPDVVGDVAPILPRRTAHTHPRSERCLTHLRRICGVCPHFPGAMRATGQRCRKLGRTVDGLDRAWQCEYWTRRDGS